MIPEEVSPMQQAEQAAEQLLAKLTNFKPEPTARLRSLLDRLDTVFIQERILDIVRLQPSDSTDAWYAGAGHQNHVTNNYLWRRVRSHGYGLMAEFRAATEEAFGAMTADPAVSDHLSSGLHTDYAPVRELYLVFPEQVVGEGCNYSSLRDFYLQLLKVIPAEIEVVLLVKNTHIASYLRANPPRARIRYVVHSELESIWLRDYAGFNMGTHLVKPLFSPKRIGDNMKLLHSLLGVDLVPLSLVWDGGNLVTNGRYGFVSTRMLQHNFKKQKQQDIFAETPRRTAESLIRKHLGVEPIWVDLPEADMLAHTDGYMTFISPDKALVSTYPAAWARKYPEDQQCVDALARQVQALGIEVERIREHPLDQPGASPIDSAEGLYVNLLQLNGTWLVPTYGLPGEQETLDQLRRLSPCGRIVAVDCTKLAELGGVLHCISFCN